MASLEGTVKQTARSGRGCRTWGNHLRRLVVLRGRFGFRRTPADIRRCPPVSAKSKSATDTGGLRFCPPQTVRQIMSAAKLSVSGIMWHIVRRTESQSADVRRGQLCVCQCTRRTSTWWTPADVRRICPRRQLSAVGTAGDWVLNSDNFKARCSDLNPCNKLCFPMGYHRDPLEPQSTILQVHQCFYNSATL